MNANRKCKPKLSYFEHEALKVKQCKRKGRDKHRLEYLEMTIRPVLAEIQSIMNEQMIKSFAHPMNQTQRYTLQDSHLTIIHKELIL